MAVKRIVGLLLVLVASLGVTKMGISQEERGTRNPETAIAVPSSEEAWKLLPKTVNGGDGPLPIWARAVSVHLPRTAAAMLKLDHAQRTKSPLDAKLRAKLRWIIAASNQCEYGKTYAAADLKRSGGSDADLTQLTLDTTKWPSDVKTEFEFVRSLTLAAPTIKDEMFEEIRKEHGDDGVASMVLLAAYGNFQDRIVLGLNLPVETEGPLPPLDIEFAPGALQLVPLIPPTNEPLKLVTGGADVVPDNKDWSKISYDQLQERLERQRDRKPRLPIPSWDEVKGKLPPEMAARPTRILWSIITYAYAAELQIPWSITTRTMWAELPGDRVFEESLFWIQTRAVQCNYCMGHCEMLLEVAGLTPDEVAARTRALASDDWSAFPAEEQRAYDYARKLSAEPWNLKPADYQVLEKDMGPAKAMSTFWWLCRGLYMTRVSDGFQLPLERENVFGEPKK